MPKPIFSVRQAQKQAQQLNLDLKSTSKQKIDPVLLERRLRQSRSIQYINEMKQLDISGQQLDQTQFDAFVDAVRNEFPDVPLESQLVGIVAKCYLGAPFDVHTLDLVGNIVTHYSVSEGMPPFLERARSLVLHGGYEFIEVYVDSLRAIKADGSVSVAE